MPSARREMESYLAEIGLGSLAERAWRELQQGADIEYLYQWVRDQQEYKDRYRGLISLREQGKAAGMSEVQYLQQERAMSDILVRAGMADTSFNTTDYLADVIANQVSADEFATRVQMAEAASSTLPADVRRELYERYGIDQRNVLAYYLDTDRVEQDLIRQQEAAAVAAAYERFQSPQVRTETFERLAREGVEYGTAMQAFEGLGTLGGGLTEQERLEGAFGLNRKVDLQRRARQAAFGGGGQAATVQEGVSGLGESTFA